MAEQSSSSQVPQTSAPPASSVSAAMSELIIPSSLKFLKNNLKLIVPNQLTSDNYPVWKLQVFQLFSANGFDGYLTGQISKPSAALAASNPAEFKLLNLIEQNLVVALLSTISPSVLPYILNLTSARDIWSTLELRLQPSNRSRVIQLKNELYRVQMGDLTMMQYLTKIKALVDNIVAAGSHLDSEDIILHILNGLPQSYNPFKTSICTSQLPISLEVLYSLLCSEEIHQQTEVQRDTSLLTDNTVLYANRAASSRGRNTSRGFRGRGASFRSSSNNPSRPPPGDQNRPTCQICGKSDHVAMYCWHRYNSNYSSPSSSPATKAFLTSSSPLSSTDWVLDSGAISHLTPDASTTGKQLISDRISGGNKFVANSGGLSGGFPTDFFQRISDIFFD
ncbi:hypothetical protein KFK09_023775 [Dendrobium nobile]|uniref:Retrovirus-related Pol polyprotein from transposon TNT 1-94 n=1 Tax=Dendrobium nobile TaxID=94219 RepID=A0A8T3AC65_DENNO|nr:hypothetical protein KFK09_023775 [Dendrobium nobile]